jgi:hypothetical protein
MNYNDWVGVAGVGMILLAFFCSTFGLMAANSVPYFILNSVGAGLACYASYLIAYYPFVVLEGTWSIVSLIGLVKAYREKSRPGTSRGS